LPPEPGEWLRSGRGELVGWLGEKTGGREGGSGARQNAENKRCASLSLALLPDRGGGEERERLVTGAACDNACLFVCLHPPD
jgi:hypothetical protein